MIHGKRMIFMVLPLLFVPLVYGLSSTPDACALPPDPKRIFAECTSIPGTLDTTDCCWVEEISGEEYCQRCYCIQKDPANPEGCLKADCDEKELQMMPLPSDLPQAEQVPTTPPPMFGLGQNLPQDLPTLEQAPPRFGQNLPQDLPTLQETPPTPLPPPPAGPTIFPEDGEVLEQPDVEEQDEPPSPKPEQPSVD